MNASAFYYLPRAPRYRLNPSDKAAIRFAKLETSGKFWRGNLINISTSGLCFVQEEVSRYGLRNSSIDEGDVLKIEFTVPGRKQIACFGTVVRVDQKIGWNPEWGELSYTTFGLQFRNLPHAHRHALEKRLGNIKDDNPYVHAPIRTESQKAIITALGIATLALFYLLALTPHLWLSWILKALKHT